MNKFKVTIEKCKTQVRSISFLGRNVGSSYFAKKMKNVVNRSTKCKRKSLMTVLEQNLTMKKSRKLAKITADKKLN